LHQGAPTQALIMDQAEASSATSLAYDQGRQHRLAFGNTMPRHGVITRGPGPLTVITDCTWSGLSRPRGTAIEA
jgi:hypothetical protein